MGAASASTMLHMTAEDVCALAERRKRPRAICDAIRRHEIDGPTLLVLDAGDVAALAEASLDKKKLVGAFRELEAHLGARRRQRRAAATAVHASASPRPATPRRAAAAPAPAAAAPRRRFADRAHDAAWAALNGIQRREMERLADALAARLAAVEDAVAAFLLDPSNQRPHERYGRQPLCYQPEAAAREPALRLLRAAQTSGARSRLRRGRRVRGVRDARARVARHEAAGPPLDRRRQSSHDAVQRILFEGVVCEVRFALGPVRETTSGMAPLGPVAALRALGDGARDVADCASADFQDLKRLYDFPTIRLEDATRADVACRLTL
ncbi:hypothetical protein JL720_14688 [Aureococcus anophagefferens]|nr:hypothetical protein JL720_14688 [Aureococcus anophagefferens]